MALGGSPPQQFARKAPRMRRHGCEAPWASAQIVAIGVVLLSIAVFYAFSVHELPSDLRLTILVLVSVQVAMVTLLYLAISLLDPAHPAVIERQRQRDDPSVISATQSPDDSVVDATGSDPAQAASPALSSSSSSSGSARSNLQCALCDASVSIGTRHCSVCRKCVVGFDHHCAYINTCIGSRNYPLFIALLTCSILLVFTQFVIALYAITRLSAKGDTARAVVVSVLSVLPLLQLVCMIILAVFHSYLSCKGLRTYEWLQRFHQQTAQRYTAKTPKWRHQGRRPTRGSLDYDDPSLPEDHATGKAVSIEVISQA